MLHCQPTTPNRLRGEARNGRRATYVGRSRRPDGDLRDKPGCVPASGCTKGAPWRATRCIGPDGSPVGGAQQRRLSPYLVSQEEKPSKSARGAGPPGTRKARRAVLEEITTKAAAIAIVVEGRYLTVTDMRACNAYASACHAQLQLIGDPHGGYYDEGRVWHPHVKAPAQATYGLAPQAGVTP